MLHARTDPPARKAVASAVDVLLEATVAGSFSRLGYGARSRLEGWAAPPPMDGKVIVVSGASSGIGRAVALGTAGLGAVVVGVGRDAGRVDETAEMGRRAGLRGRIEPVVLDVSDPDGVVGFAKRCTEEHAVLDGIVHAAGALTRSYRTAVDGSELTVATHLLGPFRMTSLLAASLGRAGEPVIVTISSGGMYSQRFDLARLEMGSADYDGVTAYARAKRAQVVLSHEWFRRFASIGLASYAMHPGWADTPGVVSGLPGFSRLRPIFRTAEQGADTAIWLAAGGARPLMDGFFLDRRRRGEHRLPTTVRLHPSRDGAALWQWCAERSGVDP
jgi:dehydrogenase/reductase SDR family protein 12